MENENETCELCGEIIAKMHNWCLEAFPLPINITPCYDDNVLALPFLGAGLGKTRTEA